MRTHVCRKKIKPFFFEIYCKTIPTTLAQNSRMPNPCQLRNISVFYALNRSGRKENNRVYKRAPIQRDNIVPSTVYIM